MELLRLPVGIEFFDRIRKENYYYVDKTGLIVKLIKEGIGVTLFTRPRRFGKTLTMSMLKNFFEIGTDKTMFDGLAVSREKELCGRHMGQYPVISLSFKDVDGDSFERAYQRLRKIVWETASEFQFLLESENLSATDKLGLTRILHEEDERQDILDSIKTLSDLLRKYYGKKAVILIDEYDVPLDKANRSGYYDEMIGVIRAMLSRALKGNDSLAFAVLTGCLRVSKESIFTGLNNLVVHSVTDIGYDEYFGFNEDEVTALLKYYGFESHFNDIREWYDGYHFGKADIYCPWDVLHYCYDLTSNPDKKPEAYWSNTSGNDLIRTMVDAVDMGREQEEIERLIAGKSIVKKISEQITYLDLIKPEASDLRAVARYKNNLWSILLMTGYLTTGNQTGTDEYELIIPNKEIRKIYAEQVREWFMEKAYSENLTPLFLAFENGDAAKIEDILNSKMLDTISYFDSYEAFYHGFLLALLTTCPQWDVSSNQEAGMGRSDIQAMRRDRRGGFIAELKYVKNYDDMEKACDMALRQIEEKNYTAAFRRIRQQEINVYGIAFYNKECMVKAGKIRLF